MPVRSLNSSILKWPNKKEVLSYLKIWAKKIKNKKPEIIKIGYFGSYAKNNYGVGSDLDLVIILKETNIPFIYRAKEFDTTSLPTCVDVLIYTEKEWEKLSSSFKKYVIWLFSKK
jgi:predicted nucleotidyltransferase